MLNKIKKLGLFKHLYLVRNIFQKIYVILIIIIVTCFLLSNDKILNNNLNKNYIKIIIVLITVYFIINKINLGILLCVFFLFIVFYSDFKNTVLKKIPSFIDVNSIKDNIEKYANKLNSNVEKKEDDNDLFDELETLEQNSNDDKENKPFQNKVKELRKLFENIKSEITKK